MLDEQFGYTDLYNVLFVFKWTSMRGEMHRRETKNSNNKNAFPVVSLIHESH